jgi:hypothetical protein
MSRNSIDDSSNSKMSVFNMTGLGYIAAGISSLVTAWFSIGENHAKEIYERGLPQFQDIEKTRQLANAALHAKGEIPYSHYRAERKLIEEAHGVSYAADLRKMGITNSFHKLFDLKTHQQIKVFLTVAAIGGIALGTTFSLSKNHKLARELKQQEAINQKQQQIQRD